MASLEGEQSATVRAMSETGPTEPLPQTPGSPPSGGVAPGDPTQPIPVTNPGDVPPGDIPPGGPGGPPPGDGMPPDGDEPPWYTNRAAVLGLIAGLIFILVTLVVLFWVVDDGDDAGDAIIIIPTGSSTTTTIGASTTSTSTVPESTSTTSTTSTTTTSTTTTTTSTTTTTVAPTTVATTVAPTTVAPTTVAPTTLAPTTTTTIPPGSVRGLLDTLGLTDFADLLESENVMPADDATVTVFAPTNAALAAYGSNPDRTGLMQHIISGNNFDVATLDANSPVATDGPKPLYIDQATLTVATGDATASSTTNPADPIVTARITGPDNAGPTVYVQVINAVLLPMP